MANLQCLLNSLFQALSLFRSSVLTEGLEQPTVKKAFFEKSFFSAHGFKNSDHTRTNFIITWISCLWRRCSTVCLQVCRIVISWPLLLSSWRELFSVRATMSRARLGKKLMEGTLLSFRQDLWLRTWKCCSLHSLVARALQQCLTNSVDRLMADYIWKLYKRTDISGLLNDSSLSDLDRKNCIKRLITGPRENSEFCQQPMGSWHCFPGHIEVGGKQNSQFSAGPVIKCFVITPNQNKKKKKNILLYIVWNTLIFAAVSRADHRRSKISNCCFSRELVSFYQRHVTCPPPIGKRVWVGRYNKFYCWRYKNI